MESEEGRGATFIIRLPLALPGDVFVNPENLHGAEVEHGRAA